jgi:hypothetical protein
MREGQRASPKVSQIQNMREKEAEWQQEREALYAEIGRLATEKTWLEKKSRAFFKER